MWSGRDVVWIFVSLSPGHMYPFGGVSFNSVNLVKPVCESDRFRIARVSPNLQIWSFCGKGNATNPTREFFSNSFCEFVHSSVHNTGSVVSWDSPLLLFPLSSRCRNRRTLGWESREKSSSRTSSRTHSPNSVLSKTLCFAVVGICPRMYWHRIAAAVAAAAAAAFEEAGFYPHREGNGFPTHAWRFIFVSTLLEYCEPYSWFSTVGCGGS